MTASLRVGIGLPQSFPNQTIDPARMRSYVQRAEALGFDSLWAQEQILGVMPTLEPFHTLTFAAACTERTTLGCAVFLTTLRSPVHFAKAVATVDHLSGGRLIVGVGLGRAGLGPAFGFDDAQRVARFVEGVQVMQALWTEPRATFAGSFFRLDGVPMEPKPVQRPHPPLWFGGDHPSALRRAARLGDGFIGAGGTSTARFVEEVRTLRQCLEEAGRDPASFPISKRVYIAVDNDRQRAGRKLEEWFTLNYGRSQHEQVAVWGSASECAEKLQDVVAAGAGLLVLTALFDYDEQLERIAGDLRPLLVA